MAAIEPGLKSPSFDLDSLQGEKVSAFKKDQWTVLTFFKANCPTCQFSLPFLEKMYRYHQGDASVRFVSVAQEDPSSARGFANTYKLTMPMVSEPAPYRTSSSFGLTNVPTVFLVGPDGTVAQTTIGFVKKEYEELTAALAKHTKRDAAPVFEGVSVPELKPG